MKSAYTLTVTGPVPKRSAPVSVALAGATTAPLEGAGVAERLPATAHTITPMRTAMAVMPAIQVVRTMRLSRRWAAA